MLFEQPLGSAEVSASGGMVSVVVCFEHHREACGGRGMHLRNFSSHATINFFSEREYRVHVFRRKPEQTHTD
jgi:hypothetical protein